MMNLYMSRITLLALSIVFVGLAVAPAQACPELIEAECSGDTAWFGLRHDHGHHGPAHRYL